MALLDDILRWTETSLKLWQRDAARRLFQKSGELSNDDYIELYTMLKAAHCLPNPNDLQPIPLSDKHIPLLLKAGESVILKRLRKLEHVNRIAAGQILDFSTTGITVIYGGNGSGKSGYARVMKRACRARDQAEKVHPDASNPNCRKLVPTGTFDIEVNGISKSLDWAANTDPPDELSSISVFDCHCARAYLTRDQEVAYLPYGLDVVEHLANRVLPELKRRLDEDIVKINIDKQPFKHLLGDTAVGKMISELNYKIDPVKIRALGTLSETETNKIKELEKALNEPDPKAKAKDFQLSAGRLKSIALKVKSVLSWVNDEAVEQRKILDNAATTANEAERIAAEDLRSGEILLPGTGEQVWKTLFEAARQFSIEVAYPGIVFPNTQEDAVCPLCQQPLGIYRERLLRFEKYVKDDVGKKAAERRHQVEEEKSKIERANFDIGLIDSLVDEIGLLDESLIPTLTSFQTSIEARRSWILSAFLFHNWNDVPSLGENPHQALRNLAARQLKNARNFKRASNEKKKIELKYVYDELIARQKLSECKDSIIALVDRMKMKQALESCEEDLKTKSISEKSKFLASKTVTPVLKDALEKEFNSLGIEQIKLKIKDRSERGKYWYSLILDLPSTHKLEEILSEGEQRAIALGSFLAELQLADHSGGIVFDDPVSSLDHWRRKNVARRLIEESKKRQVIIFTHDTSFLGQLCDEIEAQSTTHLMHFLEWKANNPGYIFDGLPWEHQTYQERIIDLEKTNENFVKMPWPTYPGQKESAEMRHQYDLLRATIERVIQDVVFNGVIKTYRDWIQVNKLSDVVGFEESEYLEIERLHKRCHKIVDAHDPSSAKHVPVPSASEFGKDITVLKDVIAAIKSRRKRIKVVKTPIP